MRHDAETRESSFENLMELLRLSQCSPLFVGEAGRKEPVTKTLRCFNDDFVCSCG